MYNFKFISKEDMVSITADKIQTTGDFFELTRGNDIVGMVQKAQVVYWTKTE